MTNLVQKIFSFPFGRLNRVNSWTLAFKDKALEQVYQATVWKENFSSYRMLIWIGILIHAAFGILDKVAMPSHYQIGWSLRLSSILVLFILEVILWRFRDNLRICKIIIFSGIKAVSLSVSLMIFFSSHEEYSYYGYSFGLILIFIWALIHRMSFLYLIFYYFTAIAAHNILSLIHIRETVDFKWYVFILFDNSMLLGAATICTILASWREMASRKQYLLEQALFNANNTLLERINEKREELVLEKEKSLNSLLQGQEMERKRIARDLHDDLGVRLVLLKHQIELAEINPVVAEKLFKQADEVYVYVRQLSHRLVSDTLENFGFLKAVSELCEDTGKSSVISVRLNIEGKIPSIKGQSAENLYRVMQELLTNALKHSKCTEITVSMTCNNNTLYIEVADNGIGFEVDFESTTNWGIGLNNVRERIALLCGQIDISPNKEAGTSVRLSIPVS